MLDSERRRAGGEGIPLKLLISLRFFPGFERKFAGAAADARACLSLQLDLPSLSAHRLNRVTKH
jgi:hypothetical protein